MEQENDNLSFKGGHSGTGVEGTPGTGAGWSPRKGFLRVGSGKYLLYSHLGYVLKMWIPGLHPESNRIVLG